MTEILYICGQCLDGGGDSVWASDEAMTVCPTCKGKLVSIGFIRTADEK